MKSTQNIFLQKWVLQQAGRLQDEVNLLRSHLANIFKPVLEIGVDLIEKLIQCSLQGSPFGGPSYLPDISSYL